MQSALTPEVFRRLYRDFAGQNPKWNEIPSSTGEIYEWDEKSDYIHKPPFFENFSMSVGKIEEIRDARPLGIFGDSVTTDHISPAGAIKPSSPAGRYLKSRGIEPADFNSYGSRRGNHEVMMRGTFANVRIKNLMLPGTEGGVTLHQPDGARRVRGPAVLLSTAHPVDALREHLVEMLLELREQSMPVVGIGVVVVDVGVRALLARRVPEPSHDRLVELAEDPQRLRRPVGDDLALAGR